MKDGTWMLPIEVGGMGLWMVNLGHGRLNSGRLRKREVHIRNNDRVRYKLTTLRAGEHKRKRDALLESG